MKKILLTMACLLTSLAMVQAIQLTWSYSSADDPSQDPSGTALGYPTGYGWVIQLVEYDGGYADGKTGAGTVLASGVLSGAPLAGRTVSFGQAVDLANGANVYARIYNGASFGAATHYVNMGVSGGAVYHTMAATGVVPEDAAFEGFSGTTLDPQANGSWIAIPEPGTIILFGLGGLIIAARKKFRK
jgi:hypothetical protein